MQGAAQADRVPCSQEAGMLAPPASAQAEQVNSSCDTKADAQVRLLLQQMLSYMCMRDVASGKRKSPHTSLLFKDAHDQVFECMLQASAIKLC